MAIKTFLICLCLIQFSACSKKTEESQRNASTVESMGGLDGGGGSYEMSTPPQVRAELFKSRWNLLELLIRARRHKGLKQNQLLSDFMKKIESHGETVSQKDIVAKLMDLSRQLKKMDSDPFESMDKEILINNILNISLVNGLPRMDEENKIYSYILNQSKSTSENFVTGLLDLVVVTPYTISEQEQCRDPFSHLAVSASVDGNMVGSTICWNLKNLTQIPGLSLHKEILALGTHEYAHILGYEESVAQALQRTIYNHLILLDPNPTEIQIAMNHLPAQTSALSESIASMERLDEKSEMFTDQTCYYTSNVYEQSSQLFTSIQIIYRQLVQAGYGWPTNDYPLWKAGYDALKSRIGLLKMIRDGCSSSIDLKESLNPLMKNIRSELRLVEFEQQINVLPSLAKRLQEVQLDHMDTTIDSTFNEDLE